MRYADYKKEFGSRSREIAIVGHSKQSDTLETVAEFTEKIRENGTFLYHFTNYWGNADQKETQRVMTEIIQAKYDGIFTIGTGLTKLARNICLTNNQYPPIVFARVAHEIWEREQKKKIASNITGITTKDGSEKRIRMFLNIKPFMRSVLIPITHLTFYDSAQNMATLLTHYGVTVHAVRVHGDNELLNTLCQYSDKVDSLMLTRATISPELCAAIAQKCSEYRITFFSPSLKDVNFGAAVAMSSVDEHFGHHAAQRMLSIIEDNKSPSDIAPFSIDQYHQYEVHFNQMAMQTQGLESSRITTIALQYSTRVYTTIEKDSAL
jgi:ABC-type uncharacterized transport system substrate-binding protein